MRFIFLSILFLTGCCSKEKLNEPKAKQPLGYYLTTREGMEVVYVQNKVLKCWATRNNLFSYDERATIAKLAKIFKDRTPVECDEDEYKKLIKSDYVNDTKITVEDLVKYKVTGARDYIYVGFLYQKEHNFIFESVDGKYFKDEDALNAMVQYYLKEDEKQNARYNKLKEKERLFLQEFDQ